MLKDKKGLTWLEAIIIIAVVIGLFFLARAGINNAQVKSRDIQRLAEVKKIQNALEFYFYHRSQYPVLENAVLGSGDFKLLCDTDSGFQKNSDNCDKIFLEDISPTPSSPQNDFYIYSGSGQSYIINFSLEKEAGGLSAGEHAASEMGIE
ncbi:MAG: hypothetical protein WC323_03475 [Patescibacteria group bacterium]|jgi:competence protein ComGC